MQLQVSSLPPTLLVNPMDLFGQITSVQFRSVPNSSTKRQLAAAAPEKDDYGKQAYNGFGEGR